jgi:hypothetical protein
MAVVINLPGRPQRRPAASQLPEDGQTVLLLVVASVLSRRQRTRLERILADTVAASGGNAEAIAALHAVRQLGA